MPSDDSITTLLERAKHLIRQSRRRIQQTRRQQAEDARHFQAFEDVVDHSLQKRPTPSWYESASEPTDMRREQREHEAEP